MKLAGKTAIVTGGGRDIGRAVATRLAAEGANVAINYFSSSKGADDAKGGNAIAMQGDLNDPSDVNALVASTIDTFGSVDVLVNNAGGLIARKTIAEMELEHWNAVMTLNLTMPCAYDLRCNREPCKPSGPRRRRPRCSCLCHIKRGGDDDDARFGQRGRAGYPRERLVPRHD